MAHSFTGAHSRCRSFGGHAGIGGTVPSSLSSLTALTYLCVRTHQLNGESDLAL